MARATWSGSISFGLVSVPVKLYPATRPQTVHFNQLEENRKRSQKLHQILDHICEMNSEFDLDLMLASLPRLCILSMIEQS